MPLNAMRESVYLPTRDDPPFGETSNLRRQDTRANGVIRRTTCRTSQPNFAPTLFRLKRQARQRNVPSYPIQNRQNQPSGQTVTCLCTSSVESVGIFGKVDRFSDEQPISKCLPQRTPQVTATLQALTGKARCDDQTLDALGKRVISRRQVTPVQALETHMSRGLRP